MKLKSTIAFTIISIAVAAALQGCITGGENTGDQYTKVHVGDPLPDFTVNLVDGTRVSRAELIGKVSLVMFFTVSCGDCEKQFPVTERIYAAYKDNADFTMFGISRAQGLDVVQKYWSLYNYKMPYSPQEDRSVYELFASAGVPRIHLSDRDGVIRYIFNDNPIASYNALVDAVDKLLAEE